MKQQQITELWKVAFFFFIFKHVCSLTPSDKRKVLSISSNSKLKASNEEFSTKLYSLLADGNGSNLVFSPLSIYTALAMLRTGAKSKCKKQMEDALGFSNITDIDAVLKELSDNLHDESHNLEISNKAWLQKWFCFTQCRKFVSQIKGLFHSELEEVNFYGDAEKAVTTINRWAYNRSKGRIQNLIQKEKISWNTRLILTNVIFFKNGWKQMFLPKYTRQKPFEALVNNKPVHKAVPTMFTLGMFRFFDGRQGAFGAVELPYQDENFAMIILLPHSASSFVNVERSISSSLIANVLEGLKSQQERDVLLSMPKFSIAAALTLNGVLKTMGITDVFDRDLADLSNILGFKGMFVSDVRHETVLRIDERGTEAAGGSAVSSGDLNLSEFIMNKPFIFFIRHGPTNSIVFMGKVTDPSL